jgi:hypothetical protein
MHKPEEYGFWDVLQQWNRPLTDCSMLLNQSSSAFDTCTDSTALADAKDCVVIALRQTKLPLAQVVFVRNSTRQAVRSTVRIAHEGDLSAEAFMHQQKTMSIVAASLGVSVSKSERSRLSRHHQC